MSLWKIAWRSVQQRSLSSLLTGLSIALGTALVIIVLVVYGVVAQSFREAAQGYHLILGAKGGKLQLTLNTVFHIRSIKSSLNTKMRRANRHGESMLRQSRWRSPIV